MISYILPVYNCYREFDAGLPVFVAAIKTLGYPFELIVVDDGSRDGDRVRQAAEAFGCLYVRNERNRGKGYAVKRGMSLANGEVLIFMDGDFPFQTDVAGRMIRVLEQGGYEMAIGDRTLEESRYAKDIPFMRKAGSTVLSFIAGHVFTPGFYDTQCGIKGFRREAAMRIFGVMTLSGFSFDIELLHIALKTGYAIARVPVETKKQLTSNVRIWIHGTGVLGALLKITFNDLFGRYRAGRREAGGAARPGGPPGR